jgi:hypothetical protein
MAEQVLFARKQEFEKKKGSVMERGSSMEPKSRIMDWLVLVS